MTVRLYPESRVELTPFQSKHYDKILNIGTLGRYKRFIRSSVREMDIQPADRVLDMGCGTGRNAALMLDYLGEEGRITGLDISASMERQFMEKLRNDPRATFIRQRIDQPFDLAERFTIVFISFVIHGFPQEVREQIIRNAVAHLEPGGRFIILDYGEFDMEGMPALDRMIFKRAECVYAFDFILRDWKAILRESGLTDFTEHFHLKKYVRLLTAKKEGA